MSSLIELLSQQVQSRGLPQIAGQLGTDETTAGQAVPAALGTLLAALSRNSAERSGAEALFGAIARDHDGGALDDLEGTVAGNRLEDGNAILGHVFGGERPAVESGLGKSLGLDQASAGRLLATLAPLVLGALGRAQREKGLDAYGMATMLGRERKQAEKTVPQGHGLLGSLLDRDGDGQIVDDVARTMGSSLLKNIFGR